MEEMETKMNRVALRKDEGLLTDKISCSICGKVLDSSFKGIVGENNSVLCEHCYKNLLFPNFHDHFTELLD